MKIKKFDVERALKNNGIELEVKSPQGDHIGDLVLTKTKLIWCERRTRRANGKEVTWTEFQDWMNGD